eukprot:1178721-Prorocentrum_minimum.AAC.2
MRVAVVPAARYGNNGAAFASRRRRGALALAAPPTGGFLRGRVEPGTRPAIGPELPPAPGGHLQSERFGNTALR